MYCLISQEPQDSRSGSFIPTGQAWWLMCCNAKTTTLTDRIYFISARGRRRYWPPVDASNKEKTPPLTSGGSHCRGAEGKKMEKSNQQSRSGWGGKRAGAGAPYGNTNAVKHGERSRRAFFPIEGEERRPPLVNLRIRNLMLAECLGKISREGLWHNGNLRDWRESMLIEGMMWQHTRKMIRLEMTTARSALAGAKSGLAV